MTSRITTAIQKALVDRHGYNALRLIAVRLRDCNTHDALRDALAEFGIRFPDEDLHLLCTVPLNRIVAEIVGSLSARRQLVVTEAFQKLQLAAEGPVTEPLLCRFFDASRLFTHTRSTTEEDILRDFFAAFSGTSIVDKENFDTYYAGVSCTIADDAEFEKFVMRSWNLDKGILVPREQLRETLTLIPKSSKARDHPLYQTATQNIGKGLENAFDVPTKFNRTGNFTKYAPPPQPSSSLNTSVTRNPVI